MTNKHDDVLHGIVRNSPVGLGVITALGTVSQHLLSREGGPEWRVYSLEEWAQRGVPQT